MDKYHKKGVYKCWVCELPFNFRNMVVLDENPHRSCSIVCKSCFDKYGAKAHKKKEENNG